MKLFGLLGHKLVFSGCGFKLFKFKFHLLDEARLALIARSINLALELFDRKPQMRDHVLASGYKIARHHIKRRAS